MLILIFLGSLVLSAILAHLLLGSNVSQKDVERTLRMIATSPKDVQAEALAPADNQSGGLVNTIGEFSQRFHFSEDLKLLIIHAGSKATVGSVVAGSLATAVAAGLVAHFTVGFLSLDLIAIAVGGASRWGFLKFLKSRRMKKFNVVLGDAIELITRALRAGHSMNSAVEIVAEQSAEPLASEFAIVFQQQKFGIPFRDAIRELGDRVPSKDLHFLITAILVQKDTGGDLTEILDRTTRVIRERIRIEGEIRTYTAQGRLTGWILAGLPVVMLVLINFITPGYSHVLFFDPTGQKMLMAGGALICIGGFIISRIVDIKV